MRRIKHKARPIKKVVTIAAPQVIAARTARMPPAATNPGTTDRTEKAQAWESLFEMGAHTRVAALQWWRLWTTPWWLATRPRAAALASTPSAGQHEHPASKLITGSRGAIHKRATANARPAARRPKR